ncbi:MAG: hypothetical protein MPJ78_20080 [Hyphomicrobiaceae bacterium]|nr:hypothetical protein [Hyphomicrobiaceae bacterium]
MPLRERRPLDEEEYMEMRRIIMAKPTKEEMEIFRLADKAFRETRWNARNGIFKAGGRGHTS